MSSLKAWVRENANNLSVLESPRFDGMVDCVMPVKLKDVARQIRPGNNETTVLGL